MKTGEMPLPEFVQALFEEAATAIVAERDAEWQKAFGEDDGPSTPEELHELQIKTCVARMRPFVIGNRVRTVGGQYAGTIVLVEDGGFRVRIDEANEVSRYAYVFAADFSKWMHMEQFSPRDLHHYAKTTRTAPESPCTCAEIQRKDPLRHFRECPLREEQVEHWDHMCGLQRRLVEAGKKCDICGRIAPEPDWWKHTCWRRNQNIKIRKGAACGVCGETEDL